MMSMTASMSCPAALPARRPAAQQAMNRTGGAGVLRYSLSLEAISWHRCVRSKHLLTTNGMLCSVAPAHRQPLQQCIRRGLSIRSHAGPVEIAQLAGEFAEISGYATVMFAITLVVSNLRLHSTEHPPPGLTLLSYCRPSHKARSRCQHHVDLQQMLTTFCISCCLLSRPA